MCPLHSLIGMTPQPAAELATTTQIDILNREAWAIRVVNSSEAFALSQQALGLADTLGYAKGLAEAKRTLGFCRMRLSEHKQALSLLEQAQQLFASLGDVKGQSTVYASFGIVQRFLGDYGASLQSLFTSLQLSRQGNYREEEVDALYILGVTYKYMGDYSQALDYLLQSLALAKEINYRISIAYSLNIIGTIYFEREEYDQALDHYYQSLSIRQSLGDQWGEAGCLDNIGNTHLRKGDYAQALSFCNRSLTITNATGDKKGQGNTLFHLGSVYAHFSNYSQSLACCHQSLQIRREINDKKGQAEILLFLGQLFLQVDFPDPNPSQALAFMQEALQLGQETQAKDLLAKIYFGLYKANKQLGSYQQAIAYLEEYQSVEKEISNQAVTHKILHLQITNRIEQAQKETEKLRELNALKSRFFANISHEFRTPLSLIKGITEKLSQQSTFILCQQDYQLLDRNADRLLQLINQLLDLSRLEAGKLVVRKQPLELVSFLKGLAGTFVALAQCKAIVYHYHLPPSPVSVMIDTDLLEKIITNLLSNAFKFTKPAGEISFEGMIEAAANNQFVLHFTVQDTGIGIPAAHLPFVFDRFYQVDTSSTRAYEGAGIGLALTKELVELQGGSIQVDSQAGVGTTFRVTLPVEATVEPIAARDENESAPAAYAGPANGLEQNRTVVGQNSTSRKGCAKVLVVEDNADLREFLVQNLAGTYQVLEAKNGREGYQVALDESPDLILSDVMMPEMDGISLCRGLKTDPHTSHIPVILLTAKADQESKMTGLETGADDYLPKPFKLQELLLRVDNLIQQRRKLRERFSRQLTPNPKEIAVTSADERFLQKALALLETHMDNAAFDVELFGREIGMSRSQLHRKLTALTGHSTSDFIRTVRLKRALQLLEGDYGNISEIAYQVGFNSLTYFTKCFREQYGFPPSEYVRRPRQTEPSC